MGAFSLIVVINLLNRLFENCLIAFLKFKFETKLNDFDSWLQIFHHYHRFVYQQGTQYMLQLTHQDYGGQYQTPNIHEQFSIMFQTYLNFQWYLQYEGYCGQD